ncbi:MAG: hypothetical protein FWF51_07375 [Chitinivibrionia bacterium]|nr:hypothetical protein [Chitinivibrionia bacterium]
MDKTVVKKMSVNSPEYKESNLWIIDDTPQVCWDIIWDTNRQMMYFSNGKINFDTPLRRDVVKKFYRNDKKELVEIK